MAYDEGLADRIRAELGDRADVAERKMFGGIAFLVGGNMAVGVSGDELMVRVGAEAHDEAVALPGAHVFAMSGRPMPGWVLVGAEGFPTDEAFTAWIARGVGHAEGLPPK